MIYFLFLYYCCWFVSISCRVVMLFIIAGVWSCSLYNLLFGCAICFLAVYCFHIYCYMFSKTILLLMYLLVIVEDTFISLVVHIFVGVSEVWIRFSCKRSFLVLVYIWLFLCLVELSFFISFR